jgi:hypothetical protein
MGTNLKKKWPVMKKRFCNGRTDFEQLWQDKNLLYRHDEPNEPTTEGSLSNVPLESPFTCFKIRDHPPHSLYVWLFRRTLPWLESRQSGNSLTAVQKKLEEYREYRQLTHTPE